MGRSRALVHRPEDVARGDATAALGRGRELPPGRRIERIGAGAGRDEVARELGDSRERPADAVEHGSEQPGAELRRERNAERLDRLSGAQARRLFVDLEGRDAAALPDDLPDHVSVSDGSEFVQCAPQGRRLHERPRDSRDDGRHWSFTRYPMARRNNSTM